MRFGATFSLLALLTACQAAVPATPLEVLENYAQALRDRRPDRVLALSDAVTRRAENGHDTIEVLLDQERRTRPILEALAAPDPVQRVELVAGGRRFLLIYEAEGWRVAEGGLFTARRTPREAVVRFLAAARDRDLERVRTFIPRPHLVFFADDQNLRSRLEELAPRIAELNTHIDNLVLQNENEGSAVLAWGRRAVRLAYDDGWKVLDLE